MHLLTPWVMKKGYGAQGCVYQIIRGSAREGEMANLVCKTSFSPKKGTWTKSCCPLSLLQGFWGAFGLSIFVFFCSWACLLD